MLDNSPQDLLWGIAPRHIRYLCDNCFEGGRQYTPEQVGRMTLDQIIMLLTERKLLRVSGKVRTATVPSLSVKVDSEGMARGRASDGTPIKARIGGKSLAAQIADRDAAASETPRQRRARERQARSARRSAKK